MSKSAPAPSAPVRLSPAFTPATALQMLTAMRGAWPTLFGAAPQTESLLVLIGQWALETGYGKYMHAYNVGNIKSIEGDGHDYTYFRCNEFIGGQVVWFDPDNPGCRFRAYPSLELGVADYLRTIHGQYSSAWSAVESGDPAEYAHLLKMGDYYTASEASYTQGLVEIFGYLKSTLGVAASSGTDLHTVAGVQTALTRLGYDPGGVDNINGPHTEAAVCAFQRAHGIVADGLAGPATIAALAKALAALGS